MDDTAARGYWPAGLAEGLERARARLASTPLTRATASNDLRALVFFWGMVEPKAWHR